MRLLLVTALIVLAACVANPPVPCTECNGVCVDTNTDTANCGGCGKACAAGKLCTAGACKDNCPSGQTACNGKCVDTSSDPANCGMCGTACTTDQVCANSSCALQCPSPLTMCGASCVDLTHDPAHCGDCGTQCAPANTLTAACMSSKCTYDACAVGHSDCDGMRANGCEADTGSDIMNCGGCGVVCRPQNVMKAPLPPSDAGTDAGIVDAGAPDAGPPCGIQLDGGNAGPCPPLPGTLCSNSVCGYERCQPGYGDCDTLAANGCETSLRSDSKNCGGCGRHCDTGETCEDGFCVGNRVSVLSPFNQNLVTGMPRSIRLNLAPEPGGIIYWTTNGSAPAAGQSGTIASDGGMVSFDAQGLTLRWYTEWPDGRREAPREYVQVGPGDTCTRGGIVENFKFNSTGMPIATVAHGAMVSGSFQEQEWTSSTGCYCPTCATFWVIGMDGLGQITCDQPGSTYPGIMRPGTFSFTAPMTPGKYALRFGPNDQFTCQAAGYPGGAQVGLLIVQ
jgi:hypothetical protein